MKPDGGHAFPLAWDHDQTIQGGMMLRDLFAAKAMQAMVSSETEDFGFGWTTEAFAKYSKLAFELADAMIAERERTS